MDNNEMMQAALKSYGAANTPKNLQQMQNFFASNPDALERRAMGVRGGIHEDNSDVLQLDKAIGDVMNKSDGVTQQPLAAPAAVAAPTVTGRPNARAPVSSNPGPQQGYGDTNPATPPITVAAGLPTEAADLSAQGPQGGAADWIGPLLTSLLGVSARPRGPAGIAGNGNPRAGVSDTVDLNARGLPAPNTNGAIGYDTRALPAPNGGITYAPQGALPPPAMALPDRTLKGNVEDLNVDPINARRDMTKSANERQIQQDVEEENRTMNAMMEAEAARLKNQRSTEELARAAKKAVGRK